MTAPIHLQPTAALAPRVLLPGDPGRALLLAQSLLIEPKMFNHNRGLWGYTGAATADGEPLTVQSTGMGGPSAAIVITELVELGARTLLRAGTCGAISDELELGQLLIVTEALAADGTSRALGACGRVPASADLLAALTASAGDKALAGPIVSADLFYAKLDDRWLADGALAVEMESAALFALARARRFEAGAVLLVTDIAHGDRRRIDHDALREGELRLGELAVQGLVAAGG